MKGYEDAREARADIGQWLAFYNELRPHQALGHAMRMGVWRAGMSGGRRTSAVDMPLRLDNADAWSHIHSGNSSRTRMAFWSRRKGDGAWGLV